MPTYSFRPRFAEPIAAGTKGGTIRLQRRYPPRWSPSTRARYPGGHAAPGDTLSLWCGLRSRNAVALGHRTCLAAEPITLCLPSTNCGVLLGPPVRHSLVITDTAELDAFAVFDGFASWPDLVEFWRVEHPGLEQFDGWHIRWLELPPAIAIHAKR